MKSKRRTSLMKTKVTNVMNVVTSVVNVCEHIFLSHDLL